MKEYIKGDFKRIIYKSDKGYIIGLLKLQDTNIIEFRDLINKLVTFTGYFYEIVEDETYILYGEPVEHPKYGLQFQVSEFEKVKPEDRDGIIEFLSSDLFPGVGVSLATSIVETLGNTALKQILDNPKCLDDVPKISIKKANSIIETLKKYEESNSTYVYLTEIGFSVKDAMAIYNFYKKDTMNIIKDNIYAIINKIDDISFNKVDQIALNLNMDIQNKDRIKACIIYIMQNMLYSKGDTYVEFIDIVTGVEDYLDITFNSEAFEDFLYELEKEKMIVKYNEHYYLKEIFQSENYVSDRILKLVSDKSRKISKLNSYLEEIEKISNIKYNDKQKNAITKALENNAIIITGGPGTGKTTIVKAIVELYAKINNYSYDELIENVALLAPTGRASKRMSEATTLPASTIHRFLKWDKESNKFAINEFNPNKQRLIIVDEVSMIDINLLANLLKGLTTNIQLILVGDYNQLPSVGPGQVLKDLIDSDVIDTIHLELLYRQDENSYINMLAKEIKDNELSDSFLEPKSDFTFLECSSNSIRNNLKNICKQLIEKGYDYKRVQIMAPMYHGENGIDNLNKELQDIFNSSSSDKREVKSGDFTYRENDKILQLVNFPDLNVFNGDIGVIKKITYASENKSNKDEMIIDFEGNKVTYTSKDFNKIKPGYIISIHKSQGSEFEIVIIPICNSYKRMLYRKLLYTGITRAKRKLIVLGEPSAFVYSVNNISEYNRKTSLLDKINELMYTNKK